MGFNSRIERAALSDAYSAHAAFRPPRRVSVSQGAQDALYLRQPGGYVGPWSPEETPYMVEPMDMLASKKHEAVCFAGPARTGKTLGLLDGWMAHNVTSDPGDMLVVQMTQDKAREYSKTRVDRAIKHSPGLRALMPTTGHSDNTHDKLFLHGMWLKIGWPTAAQLSGTDYRYVALTDYDRMPDDIDGEGNAFGLALKRTQTFMSRGKCMVESSPGRIITDPNWQPTSLHEAPPCTGIIGIYNRSDRRRWYWPCPHCDEYFQAAPGLDLFGLPDESVLTELVRENDVEAIARQYGKIICPHCGCLIDASSKHAMNKRGRWITEGQSITPAGVVEGDPMTSTIAGYWLGGVAATYQSWRSLLTRYLQALREYALTGSELALQNTVNTDQGMPYLSRLLAASSRAGNGPEGRRNHDLQRFIVPDDARFIVAAVDVQGGQGARFVVQVHAVGPSLEQWPIDRYEIKDSAREGVDGGFAPIDPASYSEDWDAITNTVLKSTYRTTQEGRELRMKAIVVDTGGEDGVTEKAYEWYRRLRMDGLHNSVMLLKGASTPNAPLIKESWVGARRKDEKGDIPLYLINTHLFKDAVAAALKRMIPGPAYIHMPGWLTKSFFDELTAEVRGANGRWVKVRKRNEALDLTCYIRALCVRLGADRPAFWDAPPAWAASLHDNPLIITTDERRAMQTGVEGGAPRASSAPRRRTSRSSYLR